MTVDGYTGFAAASSSEEAYSKILLGCSNLLSDKMNYLGFIHDKVSTTANNLLYFNTFLWMDEHGICICLKFAPIPFYQSYSLLLCCSHFKFLA